MQQLSLMNFDPDAPPKSMEIGKLYTIGYGGRTIDQLVSALLTSKVDVLVDVRSYPDTAWTDDFTSEGLYRKFGTLPIVYTQREKMGGFHFNQDKHRQWRLSATEGLSFIMSQLAKGKNVAVMCSERKASKCHRSYHVTRAMYEMFRMVAVHLE